MKKLRIGVDQDWVLAKLTKKWLEYYNAIFDDDLKADDLESWDITEKVKPEAKNVMLNILNIPEFYRDLERLAKSFKESSGTRTRNIYSNRPVYKNEYEKQI